MIEGPPLPDLDSMIWVGDFARLGAQYVPRRTAIIAPDLGVEISYAEFDRRVGRAVVLLREAGLQPGDRLAYLGKNSDNYYVILLAAIRSGLVLVPLNWRCVPSEIAFFLSDSGARLLFCDEEFAAAAKAAAVDIAPPPRLILTERASGGHGLRQLLDETGPVDHGAITDRDAVCLHLYTSGTTGQPKGALCTHRALSIIRLSEVVAPDFPDWSADTIVSAMPSFHIGGMSWMLMGLMRRSTCVLTANASAANLVALIARHGARSTFVVPTVVRAIIEEMKASGTRLPTLKTIFYGAAPIGKSLLEDAIATLGCEFNQFFGMTEITGSATYLAPRYHDPARPELMNSIGRPFPGVDIDIRDSAGNSLPPGVAGEIWVRTPTVMTGYWNRPDATAEALRDGWYRTGDGGRIEEEGFLYLTDRIKDMIISGGENIYPIEVEEALRRHPSVLDVAVIGLSDPRWGESVTAIVEFRAGQSTVPAELIDFARTQLAAYKCPKRIELVDALPRTASGKVQRGKAKQQLLARIEQPGRPQQETRSR